MSEPTKTWWSGSADVEPYMIPVREAIARHLPDGEAQVDIYNRAYEAVSSALRAQEQMSGIITLTAGYNPALSSCPLCGEPLIERDTKFDDGSPDLHAAYCHCGFCFSEDGDKDDFLEHCNRRAQENEPLTLERLRNLSTPCCLWLAANGCKIEPIIFNGIAKRSNSDEEIVKWINIQAHFACAGLHNVNSRLFFYLTEGTNG